MPASHVDEDGYSTEPTSSEGPGHKGKKGSAGGNESGRPAKQKDQIVMPMWSEASGIDLTEEFVSLLWFCGFCWTMKQEELPELSLEVKDAKVWLDFHE
jgi:hypothetical protein